MEGCLSFSGKSFNEKHSYKHYSIWRFPRIQQYRFSTAKENHLLRQSQYYKILSYESISEQFFFLNVQLLLSCIRSLYTPGRQKEYLETKCSYEQINCRMSKKNVLSPMWMKTKLKRGVELLFLGKLLPV